MRFVCTVELQVTVNNVTILGVAQQRFYGNLMSLTTIKLT